MPARCRSGGERGYCRRAIPHHVHADLDSGRLRFPACDFKAGEVPTALELARKVRSGDTLAKDAITQIITRGLLNEVASLRGRTHERVIFEQKHDWATSLALFREWDERFGPFELDVCATAHNAKCKKFFSPEDDGLRQVWHGVCWMNPP